MILERALRAAYLALWSVTAHDGGLSLRAGVETGHAVVGRLLDGGPHYGAFGEAMATAAVLQSVARPFSVLVGPATRVATGHLFEWGHREEVSRSAGANRFIAGYLERPKARPRYEAGRGRRGRRVPVVGRDTELDRLRQALRGATLGQGGIVLIAGEPGLGKTRLVQECRKLFMAWVGAASGRLPLWLEGRAASYAASRPYGLYQQLLSSWVGVAPEEGHDKVHAALERGLRAVFCRDEAADDRAQLLAVVMGIAEEKGRPSVAGLGPEQLQRATFEAVRSVISRLVAYGPAVVVLEDLHWADPTSLRLTEELATVTNEGPLLLVLTRRPEPDPGVSALEAALAADADLSLHRLELSPLPPDAECDLVLGLLGEGTADEVLDAVCEGTEGNPLFVEERLFSLLETGALAEDKGRWHIDSALSVEVPEAIERLVRSRVDRLAASPRHAIVAASVLGPSSARRPSRRSATWATAWRAQSRSSARAAYWSNSTGNLSRRTASATASSRRSRTRAWSAANGRACTPAPRGASRRRQPGGSRRWRVCSGTTSPWPGKPGWRCTTWTWPVTVRRGPSPATRPSSLTAMASVCSPGRASTARGLATTVWSRPRPRFGSSSLTSSC